jgi:3-deoxy-D-manno-octulosonic-acid transferase
MMFSHSSTDPWRWRIAITLYRLVSPLLLLVAMPAWLRKMAARDGWHTPFGERFGIYRDDEEWSPLGKMHLHAVSVGETLIALKFLQSWLRRHDEPVVLAVSTATAYQLAISSAPELVHVVYAPLDLHAFVSRYLLRFQPSRVVLVEAEAWPELMTQCKRRDIPVAMINARLSARSESRFRAVKSWIAPLFSHISYIGVQGSEDATRFRSLGIESERIKVTGSIKFDPSSAQSPKQQAEFASILQPMQNNRIMVLAASTHDGEELLLATALREMGILFVCVPRHAERRYEVRDSLEQHGFQVWLRSSGIPSNQKKIDVLVIDSTGELRDWTAHADIVIIGKSFLAIGGQNPAEAIIAHKPVIVGPHMENFQPLTSQLIIAEGILCAKDAHDLPQLLDSLLKNENHKSSMCQRAYTVLQQHADATQRSIKMVESLALLQ